MTAQPFDVAVIGAGPIGIELAVALKRAGLRYVHFDAHQVGHTISWFAPQTRFFSSNERIAIADVPIQTADQSKSTREEYLAYLRSVVMQFDLEINTFCSVAFIQRSTSGFELGVQCAGRAERVVCRRLVLCTGGTAQPRMLNVPGEDLPNVSHYFRDPHTYFRKRVLIVGGKNSAVEAALRCHAVGANVTLCHRGEGLDASVKYWLMPEISSLIQSNRIRAFFRHQVQSISLGEARLRHLDTGVESGIDTDFILLLIGYQADMSLCKMAGVELKGSGNVPVFNEHTMETNVPGLYLAGTVVGGTQEKYRVFIENCHVHVERIVASLTGKSFPPEPAPFERPET